jgi:hypothetical protein
MSETSIIPREMPKWACLSIIAFSCLAIGVQGAIDIYQGAKNTVFLSTEWVLQAYSMTLPTLGSVVFALFCGWILNIGHRVLAGMIFVLAAGFMFVTTTNGWDFMAAQTIGKSEAAKLSADVARTAAEINNEQTLKERNRATDELWRAYITTNNAERKKEALDRIKEVTQAPVALQTAPVEITTTGSGEIFHKKWGWRPEAIQEVRALGLPPWIMLAKMLGLTLGFGFWPHRSTSNLKLSLPEDEEGEKAEENQSSVNARPKIKRFTEREAREDINRLLAKGSHVRSQVYLADRWGVSQTTVKTWLDGWPEAQRVPAENGRRNHIVLAHPNGNGRLWTTQ